MVDCKKASDILGISEDTLLIITNAGFLKKKNEAYDHSEILELQKKLDKSILLINKNSI